MEDEYYRVGEENSEWNQLDEWQNQIENDFDFIYDTLKKVNNKPKTTNNASGGQKVKKSVAFHDSPPQVTTVIDEDESDDIDGNDRRRLRVSNGWANSFEDDEDEIGDDVVEEEEYSYGGLMRPVSHKPEGTPRSFEHYLNTMDLKQNVRKMIKSPTAQDRVRVRRHRRKRSTSPHHSSRGDATESDYSYVDSRLSSNRTPVQTSSPIYADVVVPQARPASSHTFSPGIHSQPSAI